MEDKNNAESLKLNFGLNNYDLFIAQLLMKEKQEGFKEKYYSKDRKKFDLQKHHIIPRHSLGNNEESNLVYVTYNDHVEAHKIRFETYQDFYDQAAYLFMLKQPRDARIIRAIKIQNIHRKNKTGFYNSEQQREVGSRQKKCYYLRDNPDFAKQISILSRGVPKTMSEKAIENYNRLGTNVGTKFGHLGGIKHQNPEKPGN